MMNSSSTSAVESVTNLQARTPPLPNPVAPKTGGQSEQALKLASTTAAATKKRRSKHGILGVHQRTYGRWSAEIRDNVIKGSHCLWIGTFDTALEAALAYDAVSRRLYGLNAKANFAAGEDLPPLPPPPAPVAMPYAAPPKRPKKCNTAVPPPQAVDTPAAAAGVAWS
uniref:AP2/ERF domain-containing protein n=1 Tax=Oryza meridionalis TaxID=40149 RepID=A0A0E0DCR6_9ORYZ